MESRLKNGFTLIELLVVIAIIAILSTVGIAVFSGIQVRARDAKRKADIHAIAQAIETNKKPTLSAYTKVTNGVPDSGYGPLVSGTRFSNGRIPTDPQNNRIPKYCIAIDFVFNPPMLPGSSTTWGGNCSCLINDCNGNSNPRRTGGWYAYNPLSDSDFTPAGTQTATKWVLCVLLEGNTGNTGQNNSIYCRYSSQ